MLNPLIRWEPGTPVRYHGTVTALHGVYRAYPCTCLDCDDPILGITRFQLVDQDGMVAVSCVRSASITPPDPKDDMTTDLGPGFCWTCGEPFTASAALDAHQLATGHEMDQEDHPLRQTGVTRPG